MIAKGLLSVNPYHVSFGCSSRLVVLIWSSSRIVLGQVLFSIYTLLLRVTIRRHDIGYNQYADHTQLYLSFYISHPNRATEAKFKFDTYISEIQNLKRGNKLKLNSDKTGTIFLLQFSSEEDSD